VATHQESLNIVVEESSACVFLLPHRIIESLTLEKTFKIIKSNSQPNTTTQTALSSCIVLHCRCWLETRLLKEQIGSLEAVLGKQKLWLSLDFDTAVACDNLR